MTTRRRPITELYGHAPRGSSETISYSGSRRWLPPILVGLNADQVTLARTLKGPVLALAGPGTGKTATITRRIAWAIRSGHTPPSEILATTFNVDAAAELRSRVAALVGSRNAEAITITTLNSVGWSILRHDQHRLGFEKARIAQALAQEIIAKLVGKLELDDEEAKELVVGTLIERIAAFKTLGILPEHAAEAWPAIAARIAGRAAPDGRRSRGDEDPDDVLGGDGGPLDRIDPDRLSWSVAARIVESYVQEMHAEDAIDFADQCSLAVKLLTEHEEVRYHWRSRFGMILVDEFQDTDPAQWTMIRLIAGEGREANLCCIGDEDQTLYPWRLADPTHITEFERWYPDVTVVELRTNYRSQSAIVEASGRLIANNTVRRSKTVSAVEGNVGGILETLTADTVQGLATQVARDILIRRGATGAEKRSPMLLARTNRGGATAAAVLAAHGIRVAHTAPLASDALGHALAAARLVSDPDSILDFLTVVERLPEIDPKLLGKARRIRTGTNGVDRMLAVSDATLEPLLRSVEAALEALREDKGGTDVAHRLKAFWGSIAFRLGKAPIASTPDGRAVLSGARGHTDLKAWQQSVEDCLDLDPEGVRVMTGHASKGLEEDEVYLFDMTAGSFPGDDATQTQTEDERRIAFVMLSRARSRAVFCYRNRPNLFVGEALTAPEAAWPPPAPSGHGDQHGNPALGHQADDQLRSAARPDPEGPADGVELITRIITDLAQPTSRSAPADTATERGDER
jgi:superfamily I DNA/RNA helicase